MIGSLLGRPHAHMWASSGARVMGSQKKRTHPLTRRTACPIMSAHTAGCYPHRRQT